LTGTNQKSGAFYQNHEHQTCSSNKRWQRWFERWRVYYLIETVKAIRRMNPNTTLETVDRWFSRHRKKYRSHRRGQPEVVSHNMETVRRLTREVRIQAKYDRSLEVLRYLKEKGINRTKSGIMLDLANKRKKSTKWEIYVTPMLIL
jgi:biotin synthase-like enzyme